MISVEVQIAEAVHEVADVQVALLRDHVGEQGVAGDVEGHSQKQIGTALVQLAGELPSCT